jgi:hypothetical protein
MRFFRLLFFFCVPLSVFSQNNYFNFGRFFFSLSPTIFEDGSVTHFDLGYRYTDKYAGEIKLRFSNTSTNEQFAETVPDSLNAIKEKGIEISLIPVEYFFVNEKDKVFQAGIGIYYNYTALTEKGYFNMPALESLGKEKVNSFSNDFSMHALGPVVETGFRLTVNALDISANAGIVPVFYLFTKQKMGIIPLLEPNYADFSQNTWGSPCFYADAGIILFKYISIAGLFDISRLHYQVIDFDDTLKWYNPERTVVSQSLKLEASLLIPLHESVYTQIGYGHTFDSFQLDSASPVKSNKPYLVLATRVKK